jgi:ClpP class serine protease
MANPIELLTRLFKRSSASAVVAEIYAKAINQPLFIHPGIGEMIVQGYLHSDIAQLSGDSGRRGQNQSEATVGILDISGAMVARYTPGPCDNGPLSYEEIKQDFDVLMADKAIKTIIGRFDSPGGMAAQNMDLSDHIYASRGQGKRLIAMVDDMAYSAAFALASAFDEIWITRTGGVGSVGVVSYHVDQSEFNNKMGVRIEYLYAGAQKIDGNPNAPLSDSARERFNGEIARLYNLFTATVARNLGISVEQVKKTEAGTFFGENAVSAGFAHRVGTFGDLLLSLISDGETQITAITMEEQSGLIAQTAVAANIAQSEETLAEEQDEPVLESEPTPETEPDPAIEDFAEQRADTISAICTAAKRPEAAAHYIASGIDVEQVRADMFAALTAGNIEINNAAPITLVTNKTEQITSGWNNAYAKARALSTLK